MGFAESDPIDSGRVEHLSKRAKAVSSQRPNVVEDDDTNSIVVRWDSKGITTNVNKSAHLPGGPPTYIPGRTRALEQARDLLGKSNDEGILSSSPRESAGEEGKWKEGGQTPSHHGPPLSSRARASRGRDVIKSLCKLADHKIQVGESSQRVPWIKSRLGSCPSR